MSDEQMRYGPRRYPVDRYLDESSNKIEMVNIIDDNWEPEPALRPEDELVLRRLHEMLRDTADDLRQLGAELAQHRAPRPQPKTLPIPLDDEFNEKVHIEELVNAKFYGLAEQPLNKTFTVNPTLPNIMKAVQVDKVPIVKKPPKAKKLGITRTRTLEIEGKIDNNMKNKLNNGKIINNAPPVAYKEYVFKHEEPQVKTAPQNKLQKQDMPKINIRSELKVQKVLQLDISPNDGQSPEETINSKSNVAVIAAAHEVIAIKEDPKITLTTKGAVAKGSSVIYPKTTCLNKEPIRKISKMSTCESSGSLVSSDTQHKLKTQRQIKSVIRSSPRPSLRDRNKAKKTVVSIKEPVKRPHLNLDEWKRKINDIYGAPSTSKHKASNPTKKVFKQTNLPVKKPEKNLLNNAEYIPYSKLTLGGARVSDIEKEISKIPNKGDMPLSPILDKILSSRENSFLNDSPRKNKKIESPRIFTTSDENLLQEVIDIEKKVHKINKTIKKVVSKPEPINLSISSESKEDDKDSYADDFEEDKSDDSQQSNNKTQSENQNANQANCRDNKSDRSEEKPPARDKELKGHEKTLTKKSNLSIKDSVEIFEFIHSVDTQENATQSYSTNKMSLRETQTSPINDRPTIQAVHNDLWPMDPCGEVEKMFQLEKDFIKKLIVQEYGDLLQKNITKPSTSKENTDESHKNESAVQKLTQTSPAHVKSVMTSPTRTKTRTTSPFLSLRVDHQTSPMVVVTNEEHLTVELDDNDDGISINLSSPRFSLRLPQTSREVLSNLEIEPSPNKTKTPKTTDIAKSIKTNRKNIITSSSSEVENSSDMTSVGEVKFKLKRRYRKRVSSISESSETSSVSKTSSDLPSGGIIPLRSEGELSSLRQSMRKTMDSNKVSKSEGEASVGRCN